MLRTNVLEDGKHANDYGESVLRSCGVDAGVMVKIIARGTPCIIGMM